MKKLPVELSTGEGIRLSPGNHSELIKAIIEEFAPLFVPGGVLVYAGDTGDKWGYFDEELLAKLRVVVDGHRCLMLFSTIQSALGCCWLDP